jgi:hypothetical protein
MTDADTDAEMYPVTIIATRYGGQYERGGRWAAFPCTSEAVPLAATSNDIACATWWDTCARMVGTGSTPDEALEDLARRVRE